jgi:hypothetical protein
MIDSLVLEEGADIYAIKTEYRARLLSSLGRSILYVCRGPRNRPSMKLPLAVLFLVTCASGSVSDSNRTLFTVEHSTNANVIHYDVKLTSKGAIDPKEPVIAYWVMLAENGRRQELSALERNLAYGFTIRKDDTGDSYWMTLVSQKQRPIHVFQQDGKVTAVTRIGGTDAYLRTIYVKTHRSGLLRTAEYFELFGKEVSSGDDRYEKIVAEK